MPLVPPSYLPNDIQSADELYEVYRRGLITRHLCMNGRLDQFTWLRQIPDTLPPADRLAQNCRWREECYQPASSYDTDKKEWITRRMGWRPLALPPSGDEAFPTSFASGENPLLAGGLALAAFSLEGLTQASQYAAAYAAQLFNYILECEIPGKGGCFMRIDGVPGAYPFLASLDELLGICVGLFYYHELTTRTGSAHRELIKALVKRIAVSLRDHGYWILPWIEDYMADAYVSGGFSNGRERVVFKQNGWVFNYPLKLFFKRILGEQAPSASIMTWDPGEYRTYCPTALLGGTILNGEESAAVEAVQKLPLFISDSEFFRVLCWAVSKAGDPGAEWPSVLSIIASRYGLTLSTEGPIKDSYFNFHLLALASVLVLECGGEDYLRKSIADAFRTLLGGYGAKNALFGILLRRCMDLGVRGLGSSAEDAAREAIGVLLTPPSGTMRDVLFHDLSLSVAHTIAAPGDHVGPKVTAALGTPDSEWRAKLKEWDLPVTFNPYDRWGSSLLWQKPSTERAAEEVTLDRSVSAAFHELFSPGTAGLALTQEECGASVLFSRMLGWRFQVEELKAAPQFQDLGWSTLPHMGRTPIPYYLTRFKLALRKLGGRHPERELTDLRWKDGTLEPKMGETTDLKLVDGRYVETRCFVGNKVVFGGEGVIRGLCTDIPKAFRGRRIFRYAENIRPDLYEVYANGTGFASEWHCYFEFDDSESTAEPPYDWRPGQGAPWRIGRWIRMPEVVFGNKQRLRGYTINTAIRTSSSQLRLLLRSSMPRGALKVRFVPGYVSVGNESVDLPARNLERIVIRCSSVPAAGFYPYVLNTHQGTVHLCNGPPQHMSGMFSRFNAAVLPIPVCPRERIVPSVRSLFREGSLQKRDAYSPVPVWRTTMSGKGTKDWVGVPSGAVYQYWKEHPDELERYNRKRVRSIHLCPVCFGPG